MVGSGLYRASGLVAALASGPPEPAEGRVSYLWQDRVHPRTACQKPSKQGLFRLRGKSSTEYKSVVFVLKYTYG